MTKKVVPKTNAKVPPTPSPAEPTPSFKRHFEAFYLAAKRLPKEQVSPLKLDVNLIFANVQRGIQSVLPKLDRIRAELPKLDASGLAKLPELTEALLYAHSEALRLSQPSKRAEFEAKLSELQTLREKLLLQAEVFALEGLIPDKRVAQIRAGTGLFDAAQDGVALADLYSEYRAQITGKHPFGDAQLARAAELGHALMKIVTPAGARTATPDEAAVAIEQRDRIYSLLVIRHGELRKAGFYLFGDEMDEKVPSLGARAGKRREPEAPLPAPAAPEHPAP